MTSQPPCTETDEVLSARIALLLEERFNATDARGLEQHRQQLRHAFGCLSPMTARPLYERLSAPDPRDPLTVLFMRLASPTREELLYLLERTIGMAPTPLSPMGLGSLPPAAAQRLFRTEIESRLADALALPTRERLLLADKTLNKLRSLASDPLFAEVDKRLLRDIESDIAAIETRLQAYGRQREQNYTTETRRGVSWAAVGAVALIDGPQPGPADVGAVLLLGVGMFLFTATTVTVIRDPDLLRRQSEDLSALLQEISRRIPEPAPQKERPPQPQTVDITPPLHQPQRRRRRACERAWVPRPTGTPPMRYHNDFAAAMLQRLRIPAPDQDYQVAKDARHSTQYDSYDEATNTFYEFKTKHQLLAFEQNPIAWLRASGIVAQAWDQRMTLITCGVEADLVWVFDNQEAANVAREFIGGWPVDRVLAEPWNPRAKPVRR